MPCTFRIEQPTAAAGQSLQTMCNIYIYIYIYVCVCVYLLCWHLQEVHIAIIRYDRSMMQAYKDTKEKHPGQAS